MCQLSNSLFAYIYATAALKGMAICACCVCCLGLQLPPSLHWQELERQRAQHFNFPVLKCLFMTLWLMVVIAIFLCSVLVFTMSEMVVSAESVPLLSPPVAEPYLRLTCWRACARQQWQAHNYRPAPAHIHGDNYGTALSDNLPKRKLTFWALLG